MRGFFGCCKRALFRIKPRLAAALASLAGLGVLCFLGGAAVMFFDVPPSRYLRAGLGGIRDAMAPAPVGVPDLGKAAVKRGKREDAYDGFTLITTSNAPAARLLDMGGRVVQRWELKERCPWPKKAGVRDPGKSEPISWQRCYAYPNGDLLALCAVGPDSPYGYGLVKLSRDSTVLWAYSANVHHDFDVGDDGRIFVLTYEDRSEKPEGLRWAPAPYLADHVVVLSPDGVEERNVPVLEAFRKGPYLATLIPRPGQMPGPGPAIPAPANDPKGHGRSASSELADFLHANSVRVLSKARAPRFPGFKAGQVLVSLRSPSTIAMLDLEEGAVVWAAKGGVWLLQHDAQFLDSGRILLFDNFGAGRLSRVLEYDPVTQAVPWWYGDDRDATFFSRFRGGVQRLPNGNTLIVASDACKILEVTGAGELVWEWSMPVPAAPAEGSDHTVISITGARRYSAADLPFLNEK